MKIVKWLFILAFAVALAFAGLLFIYNFNDQAPRAEVMVALVEQPTLTEQQKQAYFYVLAVHSGVSDGRALYQEFLKAADPLKFWSEKVALRNPWDETFIGCVPDTKVCTASFVKTYHEITQELNHGDEIMQKYMKLLHYRAVADVFTGSKEVPFTGIWLLSARMHRKFLLQLSVWLLEGKQSEVLEKILDANLYAKNLLQNGSLFEISLAAQVLADDAEFLTAEQTRTPSIKFSKELIESFRVDKPDEIFPNTFAREMKTFKFLLENIQTQPQGPFLSPLARKFLPLRLVLQPAATYNLYWSSNHDGNTKALEGDRLENPLGKGLVHMTRLRFLERKKKIEANLQRARAFLDHHLP